MLMTNTNTAAQIAHCRDSLRFGTQTKQVCDAAATGDAAALARVSAAYAEDMGGAAQMGAAIASRTPGARGL